VAIKQVRKKPMSEQQTARMRREVWFLRLLDHPNIIKLHDFWEDESFLSIVMEYFPGQELHTYIRHKPLSESALRPLIRQVVDALDYAHSHNICHRDVKPENILVDEVRDGVCDGVCV
jgi:serine/threonine protein kinase